MFEFTRCLSQARSGLRVREAGLLDVPLIFDLMLEGSIEGQFSDQYLIAPSGHFKQFWWVVKAIVRLPAWASRAPVATRMYVVCTESEDAGFLRVRLEPQVIATESGKITLLQFGIKRSCRNQQLATKTLRTLMDCLPERAVLEVFCTKYARAMQHILRKLHFHRDKQMHGHLTRFSFGKTASSV